MYVRIFPSLPQPGDWNQCCFFFTWLLKESADIAHLNLGPRFISKFNTLCSYLEARPPGLVEIFLLQRLASFSSGFDCQKGWESDRYLARYHQDLLTQLNVLPGTEMDCLLTLEPDPAWAIYLSKHFKGFVGQLCHQPIERKVCMWWFWIPWPLWTGFVCFFFCMGRKNKRNISHRKKDMEGMEKTGRL